MSKSVKAPPAREGAPASPRRRCSCPVRLGEVQSAAQPSGQIVRRSYGARPDESLARIAAFGLTLPQYPGQPEREGAPAFVQGGSDGGFTPASSTHPRLLLRSATRDRR